jgi:acyl-coenzyme A thioesterase PaaI-like protein
MSFDPRAHWDAILFDLARRPPATAFVNFECLGFDPDAGWCEAAFSLPREAANPAGDAQGGFVTVMLDEVMSIAGSIVQGGPAMSPTLQMTTSFFAACAGGRAPHRTRRGAQARAFRDLHARHAPPRRRNRACPSDRELFAKGDGLATVALIFDHHPA